MVSDCDLFPGMDEEEVDPIAEPLLNAILAVVEFGRPNDNQPADVFEAAVVTALIAALAAWIAEDRRDETPHEEVLDGVIAMLRAQVVRCAAR